MFYSFHGTSQHIRRLFMAPSAGVQSNDPPLRIDNCHKISSCLLISYIPDNCCDSLMRLRLLDSIHGIIAVRKYLLLSLLGIRLYFSSFCLLAVSRKLVLRIQEMTSKLKSVYTTAF